MEQDPAVPERKTPEHWRNFRIRPSRWQITLGFPSRDIELPKMLLDILPEYPDGLFVEEFVNPAQEHISRLQLFELVETIIECLEKEHRTKLYSYPTNHEVSHLMRKLGTDVLDFDEDIPETHLKEPVFLTIEQLRTILQFKPKKS